MSELVNKSWPASRPGRSIRSRLGSPAAVAWVFAPAVFLGAFLVFQVQPIVGKQVLPWYGGSPAVWVTCLLVFQTLLLAGYAYAHASITWLNGRHQAWLHIGLLLVAAMASILPDASWKPAIGQNPQVRIILMLLVTVGLPYFALSATGPLLQAWFWRARRGGSPYPLYAISNVGSLSALATYPFFVEPRLSVPEQARVWWGLFVVFLLVCAACAVLIVRAARRGGEAESCDSIPCPEDAQGVPAASRWLWVGWSCCSVVLFMAITNQLSLSIAAVPFLWIMPLGIYLFSFILTFSGRRWYPRWLFAALLPVALLLLYLVMQAEVNFGSVATFRFTLLQQILVYGAALFVLCMVCHGELYRLSPPPRWLTSFYLWIAFGGCLGGGIVALLAPLALLLYQELHLGMLACMLLYLLTMLRDPTSRLYGARPRSACTALILAVLGFATLLAGQAMALLQGTLRVERSFYGVLRVREVGRDDPGKHAVQLFDGATLHGLQFVDPRLQQMPTTYYTRFTGIGNLFEPYEGKDGRKVGIVGLGAGCLAAYGRPGDRFRFYELNPQVSELARSMFTYLDGSLAQWEVIPGDARLRMEQEESQQLDILVLDAFSSDAIPVHLLTREAFELYDHHLNRDGVIAVHVSNLHLDLPAIVYPLADSLRFHAVEIINPNLDERATTNAHWMLLSRNAALLQDVVARMQPLVASNGIEIVRRSPESYRDVRAWTDDYSNLFRILK